MLLLVLAMPVSALEVGGGKVTIELQEKGNVQYELWVEGLEYEIIVPKTLYQRKHVSISLPKEHKGPAIIWLKMIYCECEIDTKYWLINVESESKVMINSYSSAGLWIFAGLSALFCVILIWKR